MGRLVLLCFALGLLVCVTADSRSYNRRDTSSGKRHEDGNRNHYKSEVNGSRNSDQDGGRLEDLGNKQQDGKRSWADSDKNIDSRQDNSKQNGRWNNSDRGKNDWERDGKDGGDRDTSRRDGRWSQNDRGKGDWHNRDGNGVGHRDNSRQNGRWSHNDRGRGDWHKGNSGGSRSSYRHDRRWSHDDKKGGWHNNKGNGRWSNSNGDRGNWRDENGKSGNQERSRWEAKPSHSSRGRHDDHKDSSYRHKDSGRH